MASLEHDTLVFRFPSIEPEGEFSISFMRTLRIPETDRTYPLPPSLGTFPLRHVEDYAGSLPSRTLDRGGVIMPMWQSEAMWMDFSNDGVPVALKVGAGKINAISGEPWRTGLHRDPQDYVVSPDQPWLDGFAVEKGVIRQFVAMPLGDGYSVEEQITGSAEWGGLQISVTPLKKVVWELIRAKAQNVFVAFRECVAAFDDQSMGIGAGGRMHQEIYEDEYQLSDWDLEATDRVFISLVHAKDWKSITGEAALNEPPTAEDYARSGLPWFAYYAKDLIPLPGSPLLGEVKPVGQVFAGKTGATFPNPTDVATTKPVVLGPGKAGPRPVRSSIDW
jgi:hypothetical protein